MATSIALINTLNIEQRKKLLDYAIACATRDKDFLGSLRELMRYRDLEYQRQLNTTAEHVKALSDNMRGKGRSLQDMVVPIVMPQIESAVAYQAGVFLTQYPIFGVISKKESIDQAKVFETALAEQSIQHGWARNLAQIFRNGFKYNFGPAVVAWQRRPVVAVGTRTESQYAGQAKIDRAYVGGNCIKSVDPYNTFLDSSVLPANMHTDGEFFGYNEPMNRPQLIRLMASLDSDKTTEATAAYESVFSGLDEADGSNAMRLYVPEINRYLQLKSTHQTNSWDEWAGLHAHKANIKYKDRYCVTHFYCRAKPSDFGRNENTLVVYHAIIVNWKHVVFVEQMNVGHDYLPTMVLQPLEDGLGYQTQSMLDNALPYQNMSSSLWNIALHAKRRNIFDRLVYNPLIIDKKDIDPVSAVSRIPLRNARLLDKDGGIARAIYQIPFQDRDSASALQMSQMIEQMADTAAGQNKVDRGQFQKGNKTAAEFQTVMGNSNSRQQLSSISIEAQFMTPVKEVVKANTIQFQPSGQVFSRERQETLDFDPVKLRETVLEFKLTDGMLPMDKMLSPELLQVFMQTAQALPAMATEYDVLGMFLYWVKLQGATWVEDFRRDPAAQQQFLNTLQQTTAATNPPPALAAPAA